ncbi:hypothetical protein ACFRMQ_07585 [Kitasatospora sp. NPDC056783]|uniref:hypothetical protein n=1 Tax=Kitasatospora sp. NPDC056783 TaxID=3345943 RepID=UPI0036B686F9
MAREALHDAHVLAGRVPVLDQLAATAAHRTEHAPRLAAAALSDAAYLLAHAVDPSIEHALEWRVPRILANLDHAPAKVRDSAFAKAKRAADHVPALPDANGRSPAPLTGPALSWPADDALREQLVYAVHTGLRLAEMRYTGTEVSDDRWKPGAVSLPEALHGVSAEACRLFDLDPPWVPFVDVQVAHAVARGNELPIGAGPLDERIPSYMAHVVRLEPITQADTLSVARMDFATRSLEEAAGGPGQALSARAVAARPTQDHAPVGHAPEPGVTSTGIAPGNRRALR